MAKKQPRKRNPDATQFARDQRATANEFARNVWQMVRNRNCCGRKFRREVSIEPYTVDFCCVELKFVIEVDGEHHLTDEGKEYDRQRDAYLRSHGYEILRIPGYDVLRDPVVVLERIVGAIELREGEREGD